MKRRTLTDWKRLIERQKESDLCTAAFCKQNNLPASNFYKYRNKLEQNKPLVPFVKTLVIDDKPIVSTLMFAISVVVNKNSKTKWFLFVTDPFSQ